MMVLARPVGERVPLKHCVGVSGNVGGDPGATSQMHRMRVPCEAVELRRPFAGPVLGYVAFALGIEQRLIVCDLPIVTLYTPQSRICHLNCHSENFWILWSPIR